MRGLVAELRLDGVAKLERPQSKPEGAGVMAGSGRSKLSPGDLGRSLGKTPLTAIEGTSVVIPFVNHRHDGGRPSPSY